VSGINALPIEAPNLFSLSGGGLTVSLALSGIDGKPHFLEMPLHADFAFVRGHRGDRTGNLAYYKTARNFNPVMATAARTTIAEVEELVEPGAIDPDHVVTPGIYVRHVVRGAEYENRIERRTVRRE
jgi:3-oxoacid CoA-transferase subunit A